MLIWGGALFPHLDSADILAFILAPLGRAGDGHGQPGQAALTVDALADDAPTTAALDDAVSAPEQRLIRATLAAAGGNKSETARRLGITRRTLRLKIHKYRLES
jgi:DNA-binding NtrC family response regulator